MAFGYGFDEDEDQDQAAAGPVNRQSLGVAGPMSVMSAMPGGTTTSTTPGDDLAPSFDMGSTHGTAGPAPGVSGFGQPTTPAAPGPRGTAGAEPGMSGFGQPSGPSTGAPAVQTPQVEPTKVETTPPLQSGFDYTGTIQQLGTTTDPRQKSVLQDQISRQIYQDLQTAGHQVKWQGDQLIIDGRPYVLGDGKSAVAGDGVRAAGAAPMNATAGTYKTTLMEGDPGKLNDPAHAAKSPKYDFLQLAQQNKYDYTQMPEMLAELQSGPNARLWQGWTADGKGNFVFTGNPSQLAPEWEGARRVDAVGAFGNLANGGQASGWRWGVGDEGAPLGGGDATMPAIGGAGDRRLAGPLSDGPGAAGVPTGGAPAAGPAGYNPTAPVYTPGDIPDDDIPDYSLEELLKRMQSPDIQGLDDTYADGHISNDPAHFGDVDADYQAGRVSNDPQDWGHIEDDYQAGRVSNDRLDQYHFDGLGDLGELGAGEIDAQTEGLVRQILAHPESLDARTIAMLEGAQKDELTGAAEQDDDELTRLGYQTGIQDSNFLASERMANRRNRDNSLAAANRDIELEAARTNTADRRAAAGVGDQFTAGKAARNLADRGERFSEAAASEGFEQDEVASSNKADQFFREGEVTNEQLRADAADRRMRGQSANAALRESQARFGREGEVLNEDLRGSAADRNIGAQRSNVATRQAEAAYGREGELANEDLRSSAADRRNAARQQNNANLFTSAAQQQSAIKLATDASLAAAAARGDRMALREAIKQKATELGQSADKLQLDYTLGVLHEATTKYGIDLGAQIDREKLAQAGREFQEDLAFRLKQLEQQDRQFGAGLGLDAGRLNRDLSNDEFDRYKWLYGGAA